MLKNKEIALVLFFGLMVCMPSLALASSSENFILNDQIEYGGGVGNSANYQEFGFFTDQSDLTFWPYYATTGNTAAVGNTNAIIPTDTLKSSSNPVIDLSKEAVLATPMSDFEVLMNEKVLGSLTVNDLVIGGNVPFVSATAAVSVIMIVISQLANIGLIAPVANMWAWVLSVFGYTKKGKNWGIVFDAETNKPVPLAVVQLFEKEYNKMISTQTTDKNGRFSIIAKPGTYFIKVIKTNYIFPSKMFADGYHGAEIVVKEDSAINYQIPIDPNTMTLAHKLNFLNFLVKTLNIIRIPLLIVGTIISVFAYITDNSIFNFVVIAFYVVAWLFELYKLRQLRPYGLTKEKLSLRRVDMVILRLFDENERIVSTRVSDANGKFTFLTNPGKYYLTATKQNFNIYRSQIMKFDKGGEINIDVYMSKLQSDTQHININFFDGEQTRRGSHAQVAHS